MCAGIVRGAGDARPGWQRTPGSVPARRSAPCRVGQAGCPLPLPVCDPTPASTRPDMIMGVILSSSLRVRGFSPVSMGTVPRRGMGSAGQAPESPRVPKATPWPKAQPERRHRDGHGCRGFHIPTSHRAGFLRSESLGGSLRPLSPASTNTRGQRAEGPRHPHTLHTPKRCWLPLQLRFSSKPSQVPLPRVS